MLDVCIIRLLILHNKHTGALGMHGGTTKLIFSTDPKILCRIKSIIMQKTKLVSFKKFK